MKLKQAICASVWVLFLLHPVAGFTQTAPETAGRLSPKEFSIPAAPVFDLMGVTPSQINRTSDIKDFKVDWSFKSWRLNPNLAIQSQPLWELFYNRKSLDRYQQASSLMRRLASADVSVGTVLNENNERRIGYAVKLNLYRQKDPLMAGELFTGIDEKFAAEKRSLDSQLLVLANKLNTVKNILEKPNIRSEIKSAEEQLMTLNFRRREEINGKARIYVAENWNASSLDVAAGQINTYSTDSAGGLKQLQKNRNTGWGAWLNGSWGMGKRLLLSGLFRVFRYQDEVSFLVRNTTTGDEATRTVVANNKLFSAGLNLRYGGPVYTFFIEMLYERKQLSTAMDALRSVFDAPDKTEVLQMSAKWNVVHPNTVAIGGDWRISRSVVLNYGMRCVFNKHWRMTTFIPVATVSCMMR